MAHGQNADCSEKSPLLNNCILPQINLYVGVGARIFVHMRTCARQRKCMIRKSFAIAN